MIPRWLLLLLPFGLAVAVYAPGIPSASWVVDDHVNLAVHAHEAELWGEWTMGTYAFAGGESGHIWRPVPATLQHASALVFGRTAPVFRALNVGVHLLNVLLVMIVARRWGAGEVAAVGAGIAVSVHWAIPDAVCWSSDIYDLCAATCVLAAVGLLHRAQPAWRRVLMAFGFTLAGALCKESTVAVLPVLALVTTITAGPRQGGVVALASALAVAVYFQLHFVVTGQAYGEATRASALGEQLLAGLDTVGMVVVVAQRATMAHLFNATPLDAETLTGPIRGLGTLGLLGVLVVALRKERPAALQLVLASLSLVALLAPVAVGVPLVGVAPVRYLYLPFLVFVALGAGALQRLPRLPLVVALGALLLAHLPATVRRVPAFVSDSALWRAELDAEPTNPYAAVSLAHALYGALPKGDRTARGRVLGLWEAGIAALPAGIRICDPAEERWSLAQAAFLTGDPERALRVVRQIGAGTSPQPAQLSCLEADALDALGRHEEAERVAVACKPSPAAQPPP